MSDLEYLPGLGKIGHVCLNFTYNYFIEAAFKNFIFHKCDLKGYESEIEAVNWKTKTKCQKEFGVGGLKVGR